LRQVRYDDRPPAPQRGQRPIGSFVGGSPGLLGPTWLSRINPLLGRQHHDVDVGKKLSEPGEERVRWCTCR
jgi:hypothetical protein